MTIFYEIWRYATISCDLWQYATSNIGKLWKKRRCNQNSQFAIITSPAFRSQEINDNLWQYRTKDATIYNSKSCMESCYVDFLQMKKLTTVCCAVTILSLYFIICYSFVLYLFWHGCKDSFGVCCQYLVDEGGWTPSTLGLPVTRHHFLSVFLYFLNFCVSYFVSAFI